MAQLSNLCSTLMWVLILMGNSRRSTGLPPTPEGPIQPPPNIPGNCPLPDRPGHGDIKFGFSSSDKNKEFSLAPVGARIMYTCDSFYQLSTNSPFRECLPNGSWSGIQPQCVPECGKIMEESPYHINGIQSDIQKWPWQAGLYDLPTLSLFCGGSIISERWVLTAGHCLIAESTGLTRRDKNTLGVFFGQSQTKVQLSNPNSVIRMIIDLLIHPDFASGNSDIGLLRLDAPITFNERMRPVCLPNPQPSMTEIVNQIGWVARWGPTDRKLVLSPNFQVINATVVKCDTQINRKGFSLTIDDRMLCAGNDVEGGPCFGDAGNGLCFLTSSNGKRVYVVEGIVSRGSSNVCSTPGHYEIYTRVQKFVTWINTYAFTVYQ